MALPTNRQTTAFPSLDGFASLPYASGVLVWDVEDGRTLPNGPWWTFLVGIGYGIWASKPVGAIEQPDGTLLVGPQDRAFPNAVILSVNKYELAGLARTCVVFVGNPGLAFTQPKAWLSISP